MDSSTGLPHQFASNYIPPQPMTGPSQWSTGLCDCGKDCSSCCLTWCTFISFGQIAEIVDKGTTCRFNAPIMRLLACGAQGAIYLMLGLLTGCQCVYSFQYRSKLRHQYMLPEEPCNDCLVHCCCESCALCQEYRELKYRGFNPSLGWEGNLARQNQGIVLPPVGPGEMER